MSCAEQRQKRWRKAPHGGLAFSALGNTALTSLTSRLSSFSFSSLLVYTCVSLRIYYLNGIAEISYPRIFFTHVLSLLSSHHTLFLSLSLFYFSSRSLLFLRRLKTVDQRRNVYRRIQSIEKYITAPNAWCTTHERNFLRWHVLRATRSRRVAPRILPIGAFRNGRSEACNGGFIS